VRQPPRIEVKDTANALKSSNHRLPVSSSGSGWQRCPASLRCGVYEFSPPDDALLSGCTGLSACHVWRLAESDADASDVIQLIYQKSEWTGVNCPADMDFQSTHWQW
jgi:hypothetical protein